MASETEPLSAQSEREEAGTEYMEHEEYEYEQEHEETETEGEDYTPLCSNEDPEKQNDYKEYKRLVKSIKCQNETLENLKSHVQTLKSKPCLTPAEQKDLRQFNHQLELEMEKLRSLIERAIRLQNFGSRRRYTGFPLITTFDEDLLNLPQQTAKNVPKLTNLRASAGESSELDRTASCKGSQMSISEERKLMREICAALKECNNLKECQHKQQTQKSKRNIPCGPSGSKEKLFKKINCLEQTISKLKEDMNNLEIKEKESVHKSRSSSAKPTLDPAQLCRAKASGKETNMQQLKDNYLYLLTEFSKKDEQLKDLTKKLKNSCAHCAKGIGGGGIAQDNADESELILLRNRINEMHEEQVEFKCLMREQSSQLEDYRNKYLTAQQKVEEQNALIEKLNLNNKRIEKQINQEVKEIRAKFQENLSELLQYPKLLENEQLKVAQKCKDNEELEHKLIIVCKELKNLKSKTQDNNVEDCKPQLMKCQQELSQVKKNIEDIQKQRDMFCEQLKKTVEDLNTLRSESAKIVARTKERSELIKQQQQEQIDRLEKQLAQCRATACLSVNDRETVIKEMQGQLNSLSYSFDAAQQQIKTLRNHIAFMSNENSYNVKC
ncbi:uncharacterized protein ACRADG_005749 [Cochliomyia hominivorax]